MPGILSGTALKARQERPRLKVWVFPGWICRFQALGKFKLWPPSQTVLRSRAPPLRPLSPSFECHLVPVLIAASLRELAQTSNDLHQLPPVLCDAGLLPACGSDHNREAAPGGGQGSGSGSGAWSARRPIAGLPDMELLASSNSTGRKRPRKAKKILTRTESRR